MGMENRGRNLGLFSLISRDSTRIGSFSDRISVVVVEDGDEGEKGLSVRSGIVLVELKDYN